MENTTLIIDEKEKENAKALSQSFVKTDVKSRAYINALGAEVCLKYLKDEQIVSENVYNMHNIRKILEEFDISDIMLSNIHLDVRVVYDEDRIFIPKSHFEYNITPDIYVVLKMEKDCSKTELLGFFEPKMINKNNSNDEYYFMEKEKLSSPVDLKSFINNFETKFNNEYDEKSIEDAEILMVSVADNDITEQDKKKLLDYLKNSAELRDKFIEFENFEMISYQAANTVDFENKFYSAEDTEITEDTTETSEEEVIGAADVDITEGAVDGIGLTEETTVEENVENAISDLSGEVQTAETDFQETFGSATEETDMSDLFGEEDSSPTETLETETVGDVVSNSDNNHDDGLFEDMLNGLAVGGAEIAGSAVASAALSGAEAGAEVVKDTAEAIDGLTGIADSLDNPAETPAKNVSQSESLLNDALNSLLGQDEQLPVNTPFGYNTENTSSDADSSSDDLVFSNNDNYDDIIFENDDDYDHGSGGGSTGRAYLPSNSTSKPAISTVINTPISEATDLISMESLEMGNIPPLDVPKADNIDMMQMDEFQNLVDNYVPQKIKDESVCVDFNAINSESNTSADAKPQSIKSFSTDSLMKPKNDNGIESDEFVEEMPDTVTPSIGATADTVTSDEFVEEMPDEVAQKEFTEEDKLNSDSFVQDLPEEVPHKEISQEDKLTSDDFVQDMPQEKVSDSISNMETKSEDMDMSLAVDEDLFGEELGGAIENELTLDEKAFDGFGNVPSIGEDITGELNDEIDMPDNISDSIDMSSIDNHVADSLNTGDLTLSGDETDSASSTQTEEVSAVDDSMNSSDNVVSDNTVQDTQSDETSSDNAPAYDEVSDLSILDELSALSGEDGVFEFGNETEESKEEQEMGLSEEEEAAVLENVNEEGNNLTAEPEMHAEDTAVSETAESEESAMTPSDISGQEIEICEEENPEDVGSIQDINSIEDVESIDNMSQDEYDTNSEEDRVQNQSLGILYNNSNTQGLNNTIMNAEEDSYDFKPKKSSSKLVPIFGILAMVIVVGAVVGFMIKSKNSVESETLISSNPETNTLASPETDNSGILSNDNNGIEPAIPTDLSPSAPAPKANQSASQELSKEAKQAAVKNTKEAIKNTQEAIKKQQAAAGPKKPINASKTITLQKVAWEVPDYLSYSDNMRKYLQTAGKSIKLTLSSDLLLTSDYIYSNQVKVSMKLSKDGTIQNAQITKSSGSNQVDNIVLQTVKNTLNAVKPAQGEVPTPNYNLGIIIYL